MLSPKKVAYNGYTNVDYDLLCDVAFDSDNGEMSAYLNRESISTESYNGKFKRVTNYRYNETFSPKITFLREGFGDFTQDQLRSVLKWLTSKDTTSVIDFYDDINSEAISFSCIGGFSEISVYKLANNRVVGVTAVVDSIHPYVLSPIRTTTEVINAPTTFIINVETDDNSVIYPKVTITESNNNYIVRADVSLGNQFKENVGPPNEYVPGTVYQYNDTYWWVDGSGVMQASVSLPDSWSTTSVVIESTATVDGKERVTRTQVGMNTPGEIITLDGANKIVSSNRATNRVFGSDFNWKWVPLVEGENKIKVIGNCTITIEYREIIKSGDIV